MPEVAVSSLELRLQKLAESARAAFDRGKTEQTAELCAKILEEQPACLTVRKLERAALLKLTVAYRGGQSKMVRAVSTAPFILAGSLRLKDEPRLAFANAEMLLRRDPTNVAALGLMGQAALALGWPETAVFAFEAASDFEPDRLDLWVALSGAYLTSGRAKDAAHAAEEALRLHPANADALTLQRSAAVALALAEGGAPGAKPAEGPMATKPELPGRLTSHPFAPKE